MTLSLGLRSYWLVRLMSLSMSADYSSLTLRDFNNEGWIPKHSAKMPWSSGVTLPPFGTPGYSQEWDYSMSLYLQGHPRSFPISFHTATIQKTRLEGFLMAGWEDNLGKSKRKGAAMKSVLPWVKRLYRVSLHIFLQHVDLNQSLQSTWLFQQAHNFCVFDDPYLIPPLCLFSL